MLEGKKVEIKTSEGFAPLPADKYTVQIVDVNLVSQLKYQSTEEEEVLNYQFQILDDNPMPKVKGEEDATTRGRFVWKRVRLALNSRSHLGKLFVAVKGRVLTKDEVEAFKDQEVAARECEKLVGKQLNVMVEQNPSKKDPEIIFNNVISFAKVVKELEALPIEERKTETVEKTTSAAVPETAPDAEAEEFANDLEKEGKESPEELEVKLAEARLKAAKAKAGK